MPEGQRPRRTSKRLRVTTGCQTCRQRHVKCDEQRPICGNCGKKGRQCWYEVGNTGKKGIQRPQIEYQDQYDERTSSWSTASGPESTTRLSGSCVGSSPQNSARGPFPGPVLVRATTSYASSGDRSHSAQQPKGLLDAQDPGDGFGCRASREDIPPDTSGHFNRPPASFLNSPNRGSVRRWSQQGSPSTNLESVLLHARLAWKPSSPAVSVSPPPQEGLDGPYGNDVVASGAQRYVVEPLSPGASIATEPVYLTELEIFLFRNYLDRFARRIEAFSPEPSFSMLVPVLALHCPTVMLSCLAVSAKDLFLLETRCEPRVQNEPGNHNVVAVQFYQKALKAFSAMLTRSEWAGSDEILASSIMLSCYEIIDVAGDHFGSHLRGIASLLQLWQVNGNSPGIRGTVFWTWFRSDTWAALHAGRRMFLDEKYWEPQPVDSFDGLSHAEIANRAMYLLGQCINFHNNDKSSGAEGATESVESVEARQNKMTELQNALEGWRRMLPPSMTRFVAGRVVSGTQSDGGHQSPLLPEICSLLFLSPHCALGIQMYHASQILLGLNGASWPSEPRSRGSYAQQSLSTRRLIDRSREQILLIASGGFPEAFSFVSTQCLYIAGWVTEGVYERRRTLELIEQCQKQSGRRTIFMADDLRAAWARDQ